MQDPRLAGFNYGVGWGSSPKPECYDQGMKIAQELGEEATTKQQEAWQLEMLLRDVRLACNDEEKMQAVGALEEGLKRYHNRMKREK